MKRCGKIGLWLFVFVSASVHSQESQNLQVTYGRVTYPLYEETLDARPDIPSPYTAEDGTEIITVLMKEQRFALISVTVENGEPLHYSKRTGSVLGKDRQLHVDSGDFPTLGKTGLHSESQLDERKMITGYPVDVITYIGRPGRFSYAGFMAEDEDIISVLKGDDRLVRRLGLTHPQMARPFYHVWNIILKEIELDKWARFWDNIPAIYYNGGKVLLKAIGSKGWQGSIFQDEIQGMFDISVQKELTQDERSFLKKHYAHLNGQQFEELEQTLSIINFSEMAPYYIMRYGFYEGHTDYRTDPVAIAFVFGFKTLEQIEDTFKGKLYRTLTDHYRKDGK